MVFCSIIAAYAMQSAAANTSDVVVEHTRPSRITEKAAGGIVPAGCHMDPLDADGKIRLQGPPQARKDMEAFIHMFDVKPKSVVLSIRVESKIDKIDYRLELEVQNQVKFDFSEETTGVSVGIKPRINGDGTITFSLSYGFNRETYGSIVRMHRKEFYVFCSGPHGSCMHTGKTPAHPPMIDPVLTISPRAIR